jgi:hypothetical protein
MSIQSNAWRLSEQVFYEVMKLCVPLLQQSCKSEEVQTDLSSMGGVKSAKSRVLPRLERGASRK